MYKKIITILIGCAMLSTLALTGCNEENTDTDNTPTSVATEATTDENGTITATNSDESENANETLVETATIEATDSEMEIIDDEEGTFEYIDETVTNPTVAPIETPDESATASGEVNSAELAGTWKPLMAVSVADGQEAEFGQIYGSSFSQYGGSLVISENADFTISMGAAITKDKSIGTFTMSQYNMLVTYSDGSADTFLYIPQYQNHEVIKTQLGNYYIYFYKEA